MYDVSDSFLSALLQSHRPSIRADLLGPDGTLVSPDIAISSGAVGVDGSSDVRRTLSIETPDQKLLGSLAPYGSQIQVWRGLKFMGGVEEMVPIGRFRIDTVDDSFPAGGLSVTGVDGAKVVADNPFMFPDSPSKTASVLSEIQRIIADAFRLEGGASFYGGKELTLIDKSGGAAGSPYNTNANEAKFWVPGASRWSAVSDLAVSVGCEVYFDGEGNPVIELVPTIEDSSSWTITHGEGGNLITASRSTTREQTYNVIGVNTSTNTVAPATVFRYDDDPSSPTWIGRYGKVLYMYKTVVPAASAGTVAQTLLDRTKSLVRQVSLSTVVNSALEAHDVVQVRLPDGTAQNMIVDSFTIPLSPMEAMSIECRSDALSLEVE